MKVIVDVYVTKEDFIIREFYFEMNVPEHLEEDVRNCMKTKDYYNLPSEFVDRVHKLVMYFGCDFIKIFRVKECSW